MTKQYETVIGLEVHVELATQTKIFCGCSTKFGGAVNAHTCPVCTGMPGALPMLNKKVVEYAIALGLATNCIINQNCRFDRKNYFYPDNPQNYQISQLYLPICYDGELDIKTAKGTKTIRIHEMHMEEDAGKLSHDEVSNTSLIDYNRSGVPLIEIVSEPDLRSSEEVIAYVEKLRMICQYLGISDCKLQEGSMRVDVNLSVREAGSDILGTRTEMKNLGSFRAISRAIASESARQIALLEAGERVVQETRRWDEGKNESFSMRSKEDAQDYRYFPEPDVPALQIEDVWIAHIRSKQPELQEARAARLQEEYGLSSYDANLLTQSRHMADMFEETAGLCGQPKKAANWFLGEVFRLLKEREKDAQDLDFSPKHLADLIGAMERGEINQGNAQKVFEHIFDENVEPLAYMKAHGLLMVSDADAIVGAIVEVLEENPGTAAQFYEGKEKVLGFLVGQVMKKLKGCGDPIKINELLRERLNQGR